MPGFLISFRFSLRLDRIHLVKRVKTGICVKHSASVKKLESAPASVAPPRKLSRPARRLQLIEATIETLAQRGFARTTLTDVARQAGLSHGLVNFHFETKENLLSETLLFLADEYRTNWQTALKNSGPQPAAQLDAMLRADFNPKIYTPARLFAWCSFWGEAQSRPIYQKKCGSNDEEYIRLMETLCGKLISEGGYGGTAERTARVLRVTVEGVWLDLMTMNTPYSPAESLATVYACAHAFFPRHFSLNGLMRE
jgi:AcrR family transcriptional regulator